MNVWYLVQHVVWTSNPWHLLAAGYVAGCLGALGVYVLLLRRRVAS